MLEGMMRSALAAANMTPEEVQEKVQAIVQASQHIAETTARIEQRLIRLEEHAGLEPLEFGAEQEGQDDDGSADGY